MFRPPPPRRVAAPEPADEPQIPAQPEPPIQAPAEPAAPEPAPAKPQETWPPAAQQAAPEEPMAAEPEPEPEAAPAESVPEWLIATQQAAELEAQTPRQPPTAEEPEPQPTVEPSAEPEPPAAAGPMPASELAPEPEPLPDAIPEPAAESTGVASDDRLERARQALGSGDIDRAVGEYGQLIKARNSLSQVVEDLQAALDQDPESSPLWQLLGDAYMKADRTSEAVKAYNRGMKEAEVLNSARQALASGDAQRAAAQYGILIKRKKKLEDVIRDLENAVAEENDQAILWQVLGDAYMKADRLDESIEAYRKGMSSV